MTEQINSANPISVLSQATEILAAHGVYALTAIFIFYQQRRAFEALRNSPSEDHGYFRKVYTSVVVATYALMVLSTGIWFYANFIYSQRTYIKGTLMGLTEQHTPPSNSQDRPEILQEIAPVSDVELYTDKKFTDASAMDGKYDLSWVLFPKEKVTSLVFRFQQHYEIWSTAAPNANPFESHPSSSKEARTIPRMFGVDLGKIHYSPGHAIQLIYEPDSKDAVKKIGNLYLLLDGKRIQVDWQDLISEQEAPQSSGGKPVATGISSLLRGSTVYAAGTGGKYVFKENGEYDSGLATILREHLGSTNLMVQLEAINFLVDQGSRSFKFIADSLAVPEGGHFDAELLKHNLAAVVDRLETKGIHAPPKLSVEIATMFYMDQDYKSAVRFFDRTSDSAIHEDETWFYRGYAHFKVGEYQQSVQDYEKYLKARHKSQYDAVARVNMGTDLVLLGRDQEAIDQYNRAMRLSPKYAMSYNNLAYLYAERGQNLAGALELVNTALRLETNEIDLAQYKDTKGWILFRSGKAAEGLALIQEAAAKLPNDPDVQGHLSEIQRVTSTAKK